jgi:hypothetical protein
MLVFNNLYYGFNGETITKELSEGNRFSLNFTPTISE